MPGWSLKRLREGGSETGKGEAIASSKRQKKTFTKKKEHKFVYRVMAEEYDSYRETELTTSSLYSAKKLALENARIAFEEQFSSGCFVQGEFAEPDILEIAEDNSKTIGDEGISYHMCDMEGVGAQVTLEAMIVDEPYEPK